MANKKTPARKTKPKIDPALAAVAGSPSRPPERHYRQAHLGYTLDDIEGHKSFRLNEDFVDDLDDEEQIAEKLTQAGVDRTGEESFEERDANLSDREFELNREATESHGAVLAPEDEDLNRLERSLPLKADRTL